MPAESTYVIVGASLTGAKAAETLREEGFDGNIVLLGEEDERPYERPPLSKGYLLGKEDRSSIFVHEEGWYAENGVDLRLGVRVTALDPGAKQVSLADGGTIAYDRVLLATGASPRRLRAPGGDQDGVLYLRRVGDSERLRAALRGGGQVVTVGGGWIGLEVTAAAREADCEVTVVEPESVALHRQLGPELGGMFTDLHKEHGVVFRTRESVTELRGSGGSRHRGHPGHQPGRRRGPGHRQRCHRGRRAAQLGARRVRGRGRCQRLPPPVRKARPGGALGQRAQRRA